MKNFNFLFPAVLFFAVILLSGGNAAAQNSVNAPNSDAPSAKPAKRPNLMQLLDLTADQVKQLRAVNMETREAVRAAAQKQREARRALDAAIYADAATQADVDQKTRELSEAIIEVTKLRAGIEFRIRQILTAEQLIKFRELRAQSEAARGERMQNLRRKFSPRRP